jgi:hypothetical protein
VLRGNNKKAKESFNAAIAVSRKSGFLKTELYHTSWQVHTSKPREMNIGEIITWNAQRHATMNGVVVKRLNSLLVDRIKVTNKAFPRRRDMSYSIQTCLLINITY